jgi:hypothetical protein
LVPLSSPLNSVPDKFKGYLAIQYGTFLLRKYYPFLVTKTGERLSVEEAGSEKKISFFSNLPDWGRGGTAVPLFSTPLLSGAPSIE